MSTTTMSVCVIFHSRRLPLDSLASLLNLKPGDGSIDKDAELNDSRYPAIAALRIAMRRREPGSCLRVHSRDWKLPADVLAKADKFSRQLLVKIGPGTLVKNRISVDVLIGVYVREFVADIRCGRSGTTFHPSVQRVVISVYP